MSSQGRSQPPTWSSSSPAVKRESCGEGASKKAYISGHVWEGRKEAQCAAHLLCAGPCAGRFCHFSVPPAAVTRGTWFYYHLQMARQALRSTGPGHNDGLGDSSLPQGLLGSHSCIFRLQESQNKSYGFFSSHTAERKELQMLLCVWRESRALPCLLVSSDSLPSSSVVQRVNLNPRKCQEPHLFLHLKWEYFALFFFFLNLDLVFQCLHCSLQPRCQ